MPYFSNNGLSISFNDSGKGKPILFLHSFNQSRLMWNYQMDFFLERGYRVISMDLRGHGLSDFNSEKHTIEDFAEDAIALLKHLGLKGSYIVGASLGGYVAFRMWASDPELIAGLVLSGTKADPDSDEIKERRRKQIDFLRSEGIQAFAENTMKRLAKKTKDERPWTVDFMKLLSKSMPPEVVMQTLQAMIDKKDDNSLLTTISVPTLIIVGTEDVFTPRALSEKMHSQIKGSELKIFEDAAHFCSLDIPEDYSQCILDFMKRNGW